MAADWARRYAQSDRQTDAGIQAAYFFPGPEDERIVRLVYVNNLLAERRANLQEPFCFGVDANGPDAHQVQLIDLTLRQWDQVQSGQETLPVSWDVRSCKVV